MRPSPWCLAELDLWRQWDRLHERDVDLCRPAGLLWPEEPDDFESQFQRIQTALPEPHRHLLAQGLLAAALTRREEAPEWLLKDLSRLIVPAEIGLDFSWQQLNEARWALFPLALVGGQCAEVRWAVLGVFADTGLAPVPTWWPRTADDRARGSVAAAASLFRQHSRRALFFWPILPRTDGLQIYGASLGLAVYLEGRGLSEGIERPNLLATGGLTADGRLLAVGHVTEKIALAQDAGSTGMLFPRSSGPPPALRSEIDLLPVDDLEEAVYFWELYEPGAQRKLESDLACLRDPHKLAANIHLIGEACMQWSAFPAECQKAIGKVLADPGAAEIFAGRLESMIDDPRFPLHRLDQVLGAIDIDTIQSLSERLPSVAFRIAQVQLSAGSHRGDLAAAARWNDLSQGLCVEMKKYPNGLQQIADFWNRQFIHNRHSRYDFRPDLPETVANVLAALEKSRQANLFADSDPVLPSLGKLYGSIAQNYGFCGPAFMHSTEEAVSKAQAAFGSGTVKEFRNEWRREFSYLVYAYLDAGQERKALEALEAYLERTLTAAASEPQERHPYEHAALARFLADTGAECSGYIDWCRRHLLDRPPGHPWQIWLYNIGQVLDGRRERRLAWQAGLDLCWKLGATARPMGLLHLAQLWLGGYSDSRFASQCTAGIVDEIGGADLHRAHFGRLLSCPTWRDVLHTVAEDATSLFPFAYR